MAEVKTKTQTYTFTDPSETIDILYQLSLTETSLATTLCNYGIALAGLINIPFGITATIISGFYAGKINDAQKFYTQIAKDLKDGVESEITVTQEWIGTYQGMNKQYVYKAKQPTRS